MGASLLALAKSIYQMQLRSNFRRRYFRVINSTLTVVNIFATRFRIGLLEQNWGALYYSRLSQLFIYLTLLTRKDSPLKPQGTKGITDFTPATHDSVLVTPMKTQYDHVVKHCHTVTYSYLPDSDPVTRPERFFFKGEIKQLMPLT